MNKIASPLGGLNKFEPGEWQRMLRLKWAELLRRVRPKRGRTMRHDGSTKRAAEDPTSDKSGPPEGEPRRTADTSPSCPAEP